MNKVYRGLIFLILFWIILAEKINFEVIVIGLLMCLTVFFLNKEAYLINSRTSLNLFKKLGYILLYILILLKEIAIANFQVAMIVLSRDMKISPGTINYKTKLKSGLGRTILANSITLTPGTLTVILEDDMLTVHCLKKDYAEGVLNSQFERLLIKIEE